MKYIDLFCGMGSFSYSFKKLGFKCVMACDINPHARETYELNYGTKPLGDIKEINPQDIEPFDILCAGFPCQSFSIAGNRIGFEDKRGTLFFDIIKFVKFHRPKFIILENVVGLLKHDNGKTFDVIKNTIIDNGYIFTFKVLKCSDYGLPQMRKRLLMVGCSQVLSIDTILDMKKYEKKTTLSTFFGKKFEKELAYTIRVGGRRSGLLDRHNWDCYIVDGVEYILTIKDCLKLQGFENYKFITSTKEQWKMIGNTIPTIFTEMIGLNIIRDFVK